VSNAETLDELYQFLQGLSYPPPVQFGVTGSRGYNDLAMVTIVLGTVGMMAPDAIMHNGNCKQGGDALCLEVWPFMGEGKAFLHEPFFNIYGSPRAYHVRNQSIVSRADFLLAFDRGGSKGVASTVRFAEEREIPVFKFWEV
jgi:hypothetical protein